MGEEAPYPGRVRTEIAASFSNVGPSLSHLQRDTGHGVGKLRREPGIPNPSPPSPQRGTALRLGVLPAQERRMGQVHEYHARLLLAVVIVIVTSRWRPDNDIPGLEKILLVDSAFEVYDSPS
ncbi:uncharacterized protein BO72DRAFT_496186 [Aspergillus fijiensis CBS 313.89]|uniref:Uncharacterized protein n=1 Tax=Aspergillus fijiensis CBS 313.89 TaxID=1448319 RepID=A0A8G1RRF5_9EURO|nr:uncharacterized protein BO72DRAFT_496186 [Aspergillus fijiensis CBS 313.89]RAK77519.1 hypothetical protein BO72DRAFT_496186 [Aspergillus fijiensis CBS 313.89]